MGRLQIGNTLAIGNAITARVRHVAVTCLCRNEYEPDVQETALLEFESRRQKKKEWRDKRARSAGATTIAANSSTAGVASYAAPGDAGTVVYATTNGSNVRQDRQRSPSLPVIEPSRREQHPAIIVGEDGTGVAQPALATRWIEANHIVSRDKEFAAKLLQRHPDQIHVDGKRYKCPNWDAIDETKAPFAIPSFAGTGERIYTYCPPLHGCPAYAERSGTTDGVAW